MNILKVKKELEKMYPGKKVIVTDPGNSTEIVCEVEPGEDHPKWSASVAVIDSTRLHYHQKLTEIYHVMRGSLTIFLNGKSRTLNFGDLIKIPPKTIHASKGKETWVYVYARPGWTPEDHILVIEGKKVSRREYDQRLGR
jgi:mannose-6-phosphate isomerase-like protein (cupin superfamily)